MGEKKRKEEEEQHRNIATAVTHPQVQEVHVSCAGGAVRHGCSPLALLGVFSLIIHHDLRVVPNTTYHIPGGHNYLPRHHNGTGTICNRG